MIHVYKNKKPALAVGGSFINMHRFPLKNDKQ